MTNDSVGTHESTTTVAKMSVPTLTAMVVGGMVGAGVFSLPARFGVATGILGSLIAWTIAGTGMLMLAFVFQNLAIRKPHLDSGVFIYAKAGFGDYAGFNSAIGFWASSVAGNTFYWVFIGATLGAFFDGFGDGDTVLAVAEAVEERAQGGADEHPVEGVSGDRAGPEPDRRVEAGVVAEAGLGVDEDAGVQLGLADREVLEDEGEHQHPCAGDRPRDQRAEDARRDAEAGRKREDARTDHPTDHHRGERGDAHLRHDTPGGSLGLRAHAFTATAVGGIFSMRNPVTPYRTLSAGLA